MFITDIINYVKNLTGAKCGQLPTENGTVFQVAPSSGMIGYLDGSSSDTMSLLFLCKNTNQLTAMSNLTDICNKLVHKKHDEIFNVVVSTFPNYVDKDGDYWIYSCVIDLSYYNKEVY